MKFFASFGYIIAFSFLLAACGGGSADTTPVPATRQPHQDWKDTLSQVIPETTLSNHRSAIAAAQAYSESIDIGSLPEWTGSEDELQTAFEKLRDERLYTHSSRPKFLRRATWLYPVDGCYARAAHSAQSLERNHYVRPGKVFAFGNLQMKVSFAETSTIYWSYHVAAAYRVGEQALVLDPAVEPLRPLRLQDWLSRIASRVQNTKVAICDTYAYDPKDDCIGGSSSQEDSFLSDQVGYLPAEWDYLEDLHLNPEKMVGNEPPWKPGLHVVTPLREISRSH